MTAVTFPIDAGAGTGGAATPGREWRLALCFGLVAGAAFCIDAGVLRLGETAGLSSAAARCISLFVAMQATFLLNGLLVFRALELRRCHIQWASYMASSGVGNACNYLIFISLLAGPIPWLNHRGAAMVIGGVVAWVINYMGSRFVVFGTRAGSSQSRGAQVRGSPLVSVQRLGELERSW